MQLFYWRKKNLKNSVWYGQNFSFPNEKHRCSNRMFMKYQLTGQAGKQACCSFFAHMCFALLMSVAWCNLYKINSHLKMLGSCWVKVPGRWCKVGSGGPAWWSLVKGGHLLGPGPTPRVKSQRRDLRYCSAGTVLREMVRDFQGANSWFKKSVCQNQGFLQATLRFF